MEGLLIYTFSAGVDQLTCYKHTGLFSLQERSLDKHPAKRMGL